MIFHFRSVTGKVPRENLWWSWAWSACGVYRPAKPGFVSISFASSGDETTTFSNPPKRMVIKGPYLRDICENSRWGSFPTTWNKFPTIGIGDGPGGRFRFRFERNRNRNLHAKMAKHAAISIANKSILLFGFLLVLVFHGSMPSLPFITVIYLFF